jgi:hypothetical protein
MRIATTQEIVALELLSGELQLRAVELELASAVSVVSEVGTGSGLPRSEQPADRLDTRPGWSRRRGTSGGRSLPDHRS